MAQQDDRQTHRGQPDPPETEQVLRVLTQELKNLQQDLVIQLARDVTRLQGEKSRLIDDIQQLQTQQQELQSRSLEQLGQELAAVQSRWTQEMAQRLATQLQEQMSQRFDLMAHRLRPEVNRATGSQVPWIENANADRLQSPEQLKASLNNSFNNSYQGIQRELGSDRSPLSQQLSRLDDLQQQGEAILETLVNRMSEQIQSDASALSSPMALQRENDVTPPRAEPLPAPSVERLPEGEPPPKIALRQLKPVSQVQKGLLLALLYTAVLSLFYVSIKVILKESTIFGFLSGGVTWGGIIAPTLGNSLLILWLRMVVVVVVVPFIAIQFYPPMWHDLRRVLKGPDTALKLQAMGSGASVFLSQVLIYIAIGQIPTAVAITLFFIFPVVTILGAWVLFGERPTLFRLAIVAVLLFGSVAAVPEFFSPFFSNSVATNSEFFNGCVAAMGSGITFAGYVLLTQLCGKKLHPIPFSLANFATVFLLSSIGLLFAADWGMEVPEGQGFWLVLGGVWLGVLTPISYLLNNLAIKYSGAPLASMVGATGPVLTALLGWFIINEQLQGNQIIGMLLVTIGVVGLSLERMWLAKKRLARSARPR